MIENQMRIEYDLELLKENEYGIDIKISKFLNIQTAEIIIPPSLIDPTISTQNISFLLIFPPNNYPSHPPKLLCLTPFCFPHVADGRDLFSFLVEEWKENLNIVSIIEILPEFIKNYFSNGNLFFIGKYYLGEKYNLKFFDRNKCELKYVKENVNINGKFVRLNRLCVISDLFFLLFEYEKLNKNNLTLIFWSSINNIKSIKKIIVYKMVIIKWKESENDNEEYEMCLTMDNNEMFVEKLFEKMKYFGISFQMKKNYNNNNKKIDNQISNEMNIINDKKIETNENINNNLNENVNENVNNKNNDTNDDNKLNNNKIEFEEDNNNNNINDDDNNQIETNIEDKKDEVDNNNTYSNITKEEENDTKIENDQTDNNNSNDKKDEIIKDNNNDNDNKDDNNNDNNVENMK